MLKGRRGATWTCLSSQFSTSRETPPRKHPSVRSTTRANPTTVEGITVLLQGSGLLLAVVSCLRGSQGWSESLNTTVTLTLPFKASSTSSSKDSHTIRATC